MSQARTRQRRAMQMLWTPFDIGSGPNAVPIRGPVVAAPMAGVTDSVYRRILIEHGAAAVTTELISAKGLHYHNQNTKQLTMHAEEEHPIGLQLFGSEPDIMAEQAKASAEGFDFIDINMGCPAPKITGNGEGSALMDQPELAGRIVRAVSEAVSVPVTVKIRKGRRKGEETCVEIARICEENGACAITVHGRTADQMYSGEADWDCIRHVREAVSIPVIGNGDVVDGPSAEKMFAKTHCQAVMIGRACEGDPWVFDRTIAYLKGEEVPERPSEEEVFRQALLHAQKEVEEKGERQGMCEMRKHLLWYMKVVSSSARRRELRRRLSTVSTIKELEAILNG